MLYVQRMGNPADTIQLLETFLRIVDNGSLSAAARTLGVSQASVSRQLVALETRLSVSLARRTTQDFRLTLEGEKLLPQARALLTTWEETKVLLGQAESEPEGALKVVAPTGFGPLIIAPAAARFVREYPKVDIDLTFKDHAEDLVGQGVDMQVIVGAVERQELLIRRIGNVRRWLVAASDLDLTAYQNDSGGFGDGLPIVALAPLYDSRITLRQSQGSSRSRTISLNCRVRIRCEVLFAAHKAVLAGAGVGLLPVWLIGPDVAAGRLVRLLPDSEVPPVPVHLVFPPDRFRPSRSQHFAELIEREIKNVS